MSSAPNVKTYHIDLSNLRALTNPWAYKLFGDTHRNLVLQGGAGSGKSVFAAQKVVVRCITEANHHICCFRKVASSVKVSVLPQLKAAIISTGTQALWKENKTNGTLTFVPNGSIIRVLGLDDPEKLKSIFNMTGAWMEEATEFNEGDFKQLNLRLRGITRYYKQIIITFNPINILHWLKKRFVDNLTSRDLLVKTTFLDNSFIDDEYAEELKAYELSDPYVWKVYGLGDWGHSEGLIYQYPTTLPKRAWPDARLFRTKYYGLDWGFNHPTALVAIHTDPEPLLFQSWVNSCADIAPELAYLGDRDHPCAKDFGPQEQKYHFSSQVNDELLAKSAFVSAHVYRTNMTTPQLISKMKKLGIQYWERIYADPAQPGSIRELQDAGFNVVPAEKGAGSIVAGIRHVRSYKIFTPENDVDLNNEFSLYHWKTNKEKTTDEPVDAFNHGMDAIRYGLWTFGLESGTVRIGKI